MKIYFFKINEVVTTLDFFFQLGSGIMVLNIKLNYYFSALDTTILKNPWSFFQDTHY